MATATTNSELGGQPAVVSPLPPAWSIDSLPVSHPAVVYLHSRGFDPAALACDWQVGYSPPTNDYIASDRIIIPVWRYEHDYWSPGMTPPLVLGGWVSRAVGDGQDTRPKYLNTPGMPKAKLLYGLHLAVNNLTGPVVICEGPTDCWRIGPGAVALFGKDLLPYQKVLLVHHFTDRPMVVLLDRDARAKAVGIQLELQRARGLSAGDRRVIMLDLPPGRNDPGECTREEIWGVIAAALAPTT